MVVHSTVSCARLEKGCHETATFIVLFVMDAAALIERFKPIKAVKRDPPCQLSITVFRVGMLIIAAGCQPPQEERRTRRVWSGPCRAMLVRWTWREFALGPEEKQRNACWCILGLLFGTRDFYYSQWPFRTLNSSKMFRMTWSLWGGSRYIPKGILWEHSIKRLIRPTNAFGSQIFVLLLDT